MSRANPTTAADSVGIGKSREGGGKDGELDQRLESSASRFRHLPAALAEHFPDSCRGFPQQIEGRTLSRRKELPEGVAFECRIDQTVGRSGAWAGTAKIGRRTELSSKAELKKAPLAFWGVSAGSNVSSRYCVFFPDRVAAFASSTGTCGPGGEISAKTLAIPMLFAIGGKDKPDWVKSSIANAERGQGKAPWTVALQKIQGHGVGKSMDVIVPFLVATVKQRLGVASPSQTSPSIFKSELPTIGTSSYSAASTQKTLKKLNIQSGWLGNPDTYDVSAYAEYKGNKAKAIWLPDEPTALAWQAYLRAP